MHRKSTKGAGRRSVGRKVRLSGQLSRSYVLGQDGAAAVTRCRRGVGTRWVWVLGCTEWGKGKRKGMRARICCCMQLAGAKRQEARIAARSPSHIKLSEHKRRPSSIASSVFPHCIRRRHLVKSFCIPFRAHLQWQVSHMKRRKKFCRTMPARMSTPSKLLPNYPRYRDQSDSPQIINALPSVCMRRMESQSQGNSRKCSQTTSVLVEALQEDD